MSGLMSGMQLHANVVATLRSARRTPVILPPLALCSLTFACCLLVMLPLWRWPLRISIYQP